MKKLVIALVLLLIISTSNVWALDTDLAYGGVSLMGAGALAIGTAAILDLGDAGIVLYVVGGLAAAFGLWFFIWGLIDDTSYAMIENNDVLKHVSFDIRGNDLFLGAKFKF